MTHVLAPLFAGETEEHAAADEDDFQTELQQGLPRGTPLPGGRGLFPCVSLFLVEMGHVNVGHGRQ